MKISYLSRNLNANFSKNLVDNSIPFLFIHPSLPPSSELEMGMAPSERGTNVKNDYPGFQWTKAHIASPATVAQTLMHSVGRASAEVYL